MAKSNPHAVRTAPLEMEGRPPAVHPAHRAVAADHGGRDRAQADRRDPGYPVSLPRQQDPQPLGPGTHLTADAVESPLPRDGHGGVGERARGTDRGETPHRPPGLTSPPLPRARPGLSPAGSRAESAEVTAGDR